MTEVKGKPEAKTNVIDATQKHWPKQVVRVTCEYVNDRLSPEVRMQLYTSSTTGQQETIENLHPTHAKNALAKVLRELAAGKMAYMSDDGTIKYV